MEPLNVEFGCSWKAEVSGSAQGSEFEYLRWIYRQLDQNTIRDLEKQYRQETGKNVPTVNLL